MSTDEHVDTMGSVISAMRLAAEKKLKLRLRTVGQDIDRDTAWGSQQLVGLNAWIKASDD